MEWPGYDMYNAPRVVIADRPGRGRPRLGSDHPRQTMYFTDSHGNLLPQAVPGVGRSNSVSGGRPAQIVINNTQHDEFSPPHSAHARRRSRARSPSYDSDDSWDERAHSPRRHRRGSVLSQARDRSRDRSRRRSRDRSRHRSRSHSSRRHSHSHHHGHASRSPSPAHLDYETQLKLKRYEEFERKEKEEAARERARQDMLIADAKKAAEKKKEEEFKQRVIAEAEREKYEKEMKEKKKKEEEDKVFKARLKDMYLAQGYSEESIEKMIKDAQEKKKHGHGHGHGSPSPHGPHSIGGHENEIVKIESTVKVVDLNRPTFIKVHRKHLSPVTLDAYGLPWEWDDRDSNYIIIKRWITENDQDKLFEHSRKLREQKLLTNETLELKKENGKLKLVREKSPNRQRSRSHSRSWIFT
ncbi:MAG: hypothetical protein Q9208_000948 [Pyrenodesmia sp. 3 TL-2023]